MPDNVHLSSAADRYERLSEARSPYLERAYEVAELTIPSAFTRPGIEVSDETPWQGIGSRGMRNLASKLMLALFPPGRPFFRLSLNEEQLADAFSQLDSAAATKTKTQILEALGKLEMSLVNRFETLPVRTTLFEAFLQLLIAGTCILEMRSDYVRLYDLRDFVAVRDSRGNVVEMIIKEVFVFDTVPETVQEQYLAASPGAEVSGLEEITIFTHVRRSGRRFRRAQYLGIGTPEDMEQKIHGTEETYALDEVPYLLLGFTENVKQSYPRSFGDELLADLNGFQGLSRGLILAAAQLAKVVWLVDPNGMTDIEDITNADTADAVPGTERDVSVLQANKSADLGTVYNVYTTMKSDLERAFLMNSSLPRDAERVTAEEIRFIAQELEDALGGVYSNLTHQLQRPLVAWLLRLLKEDKIVGRDFKLDKDIRLEIVSGVDALGRARELRALEQWASTMISLFPTKAEQAIRVGDFARRHGVNSGIDVQGLIRSEEEMLAEQQEAQRQALAEKAVGPAINAAAAQQEVPTPTQ